MLPPVPPFSARPTRRRPLPDAVAVQRIPLPESAPPYDDQTSSGSPAGGGAASGQGQARSGQAGAGARREPGSPEAARPAGGTEWSRQFAQALAETLAGSRSPGQMTPWTTEQVRKRIRQLGPMLQADQRPRLRRIVTSEPDPDVVEMTVILGIGPRTRALAVRLERSGPDEARPEQERPWLCTDIEAA
jgi:hypothetical protein